MKERGEINNSPSSETEGVSDRLMQADDGVTTSHLQDSGFRRGGATIAGDWDDEELNVSENSDISNSDKMELTDDEECKRRSVTDDQRVSDLGPSDLGLSTSTEEDVERNDIDDVSEDVEPEHESVATGVEQRKEGRESLQQHPIINNNKGKDKLRAASAQRTEASSPNQVEEPKIDLIYSHNRSVASRAASSSIPSVEVRGNNRLKPPPPPSRSGLSNKSLSSGGGSSRSVNRGRRMAHVNISTRALSHINGPMRRSNSTDDSDLSWPKAAPAVHANSANQTGKLKPTPPAIGRGLANNSNQTTSCGSLKRGLSSKRGLIGRSKSYDDDSVNPWPKTTKPAAAMSEKNKACNPKLVRGCSRPSSGRGLSNKDSIQHFHLREGSSGNFDDEKVLAYASNVAEQDVELGKEGNLKPAMGRTTTSKDQDSKLANNTSTYSELDEKIWAATYVANGSRNNRTAGRRRNESNQTTNNVKELRRDPFMEKAAERQYQAGREDLIVGLVSRSRSNSPTVARYRREPSQTERPLSMGVGRVLRQDHSKVEHRTTAPLDRTVCTRTSAVLHQAQEFDNHPPRTTLTEDQYLSTPGCYAIPGSAPFSSTSGESVHALYDLETGSINGVSEQSVSWHGDDEPPTRQDELLVEATLVPQSRAFSIVLGNYSASSALVVEAKPMRLRLPNRLTLAVVSILIVIIVGLAIGLRGPAGESSIASDREETADLLLPENFLGPTAAPIPTLERIRQRGVLRCGHDGAVETLLELVQKSHQIEFESASGPVKATANGARHGFDNGVCRAIAAALMGEDAVVESVLVYEGTKLEMLANGTIDVLVTKSHLTMENDVFVPSIGTGLAYGTPFLATGVGFTGVPKYVDCMEDDINTLGDCGEAVICVSSYTSFASELQIRVPQRQLVVVDEAKQTLSGFLSASCNVIAGQMYRPVNEVLRGMGYSGELKTGSVEFNREMYSMATLDGDPQWTDFLNTVVLGLLAAEKHGITQDTAHLMGETHVFGEEFSEMLINAVKIGGGMGQMYDWEIGWVVPRQQRNYINNGTTGLLFSSPLGSFLDEGPAPVEGSTLLTILERGFLSCGVRADRPGFGTLDVHSSTWQGMDVEYCTAVASSLSLDPVIVAFNDSSTGFELLAQGEIDVFAGAVWTLQNNVREPSTNESFSFTKPYFYGPVDEAIEHSASNSNRSTFFDENLCLATRRDDAQWSSFVFWVADSLVLAEEAGVTQRSSTYMPLVNLFGTSLARMLRDAVHFVGNYREIYERNVAEHLPRGGRNMLTGVKEQNPLYYVPPGFF